MNPRRRTDDVPYELAYLSRWAVVRRGESWIERVANALWRWHEVLEVDPGPVSHRWLRGCYCSDGKHGQNG